MIEFAFSLVFLLLITVGITEIGRAFWYYSALQTAVRDGARCASTRPVNDVAYCRQLVVANANAAGVLNRAAGGISGLSTANVSIGYDADPPEYVIARIIDYRMPWLNVVPADEVGPMVIPPPGQGPSVGLDVRAVMPYLYEASP